MTTNLLRSLSLKDAVSLVVGTIIGTGVFLKTAVMSQHLPSPFWVLLAWTAAGFLSLLGALSYAELGSMFPRVGGEYVYLREAYGKLPGFLFGWSRFWIGGPASIAAYGVAAATFASALFGGYSKQTGTVVALSLIAFFTISNCLKVAVGGRIQTALTILKVGMVIGLSLAVFLFSDTATIDHFAIGGEASNNMINGFGMAMLAALWAFDGWNNLPMAAGEIENAERSLPRSLILGMALCIVVYALANLAYFYALPFAEVVSSNSRAYPNALPVATKAAQSVFGSLGVSLLSAAFVISALGAMNGAVLTNSRVTYAMARDGLFIRALGTLNSRSHTPVRSILMQGGISAVLALSGSFDQLTDYVVFSAWIFYALTTSSLFVFRKRNIGSAYRVPLFPWTPIVFILLSICLLINTVISSPQESAIGLLILAAGVPVFYFYERKSR